MGRITLYRNAAGWHADMSAATGVEGIRRLFGTDQLPTAYTARADWQHVRLAVAARNPSDEVQVDILSREAVTHQEKAEGCGEFVRDGLACLGPTRWGRVVSRDWLIERDQIVNGARQAGHWGRLALAEVSR